VNRLQSIYRLALKELASLSRDVALVGLIIYAFTYAVYGPAKGARMELRNAAVAIIDEDHSALSARLGDALLPPLFQTPRYLDRSEIDTAMDAGRFTFIVDIPPRFQADIQAGRQPALQVNVDATAMSQAGRGAGYINEIFTSEIARFANARTAQKPPVQLVVRAKFNANLSDTWFLGVSQIINNITLLAIILSGAAVVREREHGTIEHLLVLPLRPSDIMLAKVVANGFAIVGVATLSLWIVVQGLLQVPIAGSITLFVLDAIVYLFSVTSLGILLATIARSMPQFGLLAFLVYLVLNMLSGGATPLDSMPDWLQRLIQLSPATHFVNSALAILYRGADFSSVAYEVLITAGIGVLFFAIALGRFRNMIAIVQLRGV
jgi:ABC-2 type transport system permease protein